MNKNSKVTVAVAGASGYTGAELLRYLSLHPHAEVVATGASSSQGQAVECLFPNLRGFQEGPLGDSNWERLGRAADVVMLCLPHGESQVAADRLLQTDCKVIDLGGDFRLRDATIYSNNYPELLAQAVYGMPELNREAIRTARLVANPGCYPTASLLALLPLARAGLLTGPVIVDAKSGVSGAGRSAKIGSLFAEVNENLRPYSVEEHRHRPEIEQGLGLGGQQMPVVFTPQLVPMTRGILVTAYAPVRGDDDLTALYRDFYAAEPFVKVLESELPATKATSGSNYCHLAVRRTPVPGLVLLMSAIDNLGKGAAGTAIHNLNLMFGFPEECGLRSPGLYP